MHADAGKLKVAGFVLPVRAASVRSRVAFVSLREAIDPVRAIADAVRESPRILTLDGIDTVTDALTRRNLHDALSDAKAESLTADRPLALVVGTAFPDALSDAIPGAVDASRVALTSSTLSHEAEVPA
jgi:RND superfamily putative drug exporter